MENKIKVLELPIELVFAKQALIFGIISILSFFTPFTLGHPQWLVGTAVNTCLFLAAIFLPKKYFIPLSVLPSLGVLARGIVFGPLTLFLVYFLPFIWLGNLVLIFAFKGLFLRTGYIFSATASSAAKFLFLFLTANIYFKFYIVPALFLRTMGFNQLSTALAGGLISFIIFKIHGQLNAGSKRAS
jgi:hypothetical protein